MSNSVDDESNGLVMTEEEEQQIYRIANLTNSSNSSVSSKQPKARRSLMERIASLRTVGSSASSVGGGGYDNSDCRSVSSVNPKLENSYKDLEDEYCKLKFEQTELIALADQRKLQKMKSSELLNSLEDEKKEVSTKNSKYRRQVNELRTSMNEMPKAFTSKHEQRTLKSMLNSLLLKKDLEALRLSESKESLKNARKILDEKLLPALEMRPDACNYSVLHELERRDRHDYVNDLIDAVKDLKYEIEQMRYMRSNKTEEENQQVRKKSSSSHEDFSMIGKDIVLDGDSQTEDATMGSSYNDVSQIHVKCKDGDDE